MHSLICNLLTTLYNSLSAQRNGLCGASHAGRSARTAPAPRRQRGRARAPAGGSGCGCTLSSLVNVTEMFCPHMENHVKCGFWIALYSYMVYIFTFYYRYFLSLYFLLLSAFHFYPCRARWKNFLFHKYGAHP